MQLGGARNSGAVDVHTVSVMRKYSPEAFTSLTSPRSHHLDFRYSIWVPSTIGALVWLTEWIFFASSASCRPGGWGIVNSGPESREPCRHVLPPLSYKNLFGFQVNASRSCAALGFGYKWQKRLQLCKTLKNRIGVACLRLIRQTNESLRWYEIFYPVRNTARASLCGAGNGV